MIERSMTTLRPDSLTWTALLGQWIDFARASVALPQDAESERWRRSVPAIITLQAVTFALADLDRLSATERALARDKAELLISGSAAELRSIWGGQPMPASLLEIGEDARAALARSRYAGAVELIWPGPGVLIMPPLGAMEPGGTLAVMAPGTLVMPAEPVAWWIDRTAVQVRGCELNSTPCPRQVYRQIDERGRITGDVIAPMDAPLPGGMPLLVPLYENGEPVGHFTMSAEAWLARQREAMHDEHVPVERRDGAAPGEKLHERGA